MNSNAPESCVDHYLFWRTERFGVQERVTLQDQFDEKPFPAFLPDTQFLGNPAAKTRRGREVEDIHQAKVHLVAYTLDGGRPAPPVVTVRNQFTGDDGQPWQLGAPRLLLIPARKTVQPEPPPETPPPPRVDHFLCYDVLGVPPVDDEVVLLKDQFGIVETNFLRPILFGLPVSKNGEGLIHPDVHLALYDIQPRQKPAKPIVAQTSDQLRRFQFPIIETAWLGVPSLNEWKR